MWKDYFLLQKQVLNTLLEPGSLGAGQWYSSKTAQALPGTVGNEHVTACWHAALGRGVLLGATVTP